MLIVGAMIGWSVKPDSTQNEKAPFNVRNQALGTQSTPKESNNTIKFTVPNRRSMRETTAKTTPTVPGKVDMQQAKKMQSEMTKSMVNRQRSKFEQYVERMTEVLDLKPEQKARMTAALDEQMQKLEKLDLSDPESISSLDDLMKGLDLESMDDQLIPTLSEQQKTALAEIKQKDHQTKVDSAALKSLSRLQGIIEFEEGQRDEVYKILSNEAEEKLAKQVEKPDLTTFFTEGMGIEMDPYDLGLQQAMADAVGDLAQTGGTVDQKQISKAMREIIDQHINEKVEALRPVLNDKQLDLYRTELKTKGAGFYGTALMGMEAADSPDQ